MMAPAAEREAEVVLGPAAAHLAEPLTRALGRRPIEATVRDFPDGECCVAAEAPFDAPLVVIVQGSHAPQDRSLQQLYQLVDIAVHRRAQRIAVVAPYLAYARQDRRTSDAEPHSLSIVLRTLAGLGVSDLVTIDVHNPDSLSGLATINLSAVGLFVAHLVSRRRSDLILVSPDKGGRRRAGAAAAALGTPFFAYDKIKDAAGRTSFGPGSNLLVGRHAVVFDDLCSSGSTLVPLSEQLMRDGAAGVTVCVTHLLADRGRLAERLGGCVDVLCTDTIPGAPAVVSVADLIVEAIGTLVHTPSAGAEP